MKNRKYTQSRGVVYSTGSGRMCPRCNRPATACACSKAPAAPAGDGIVRVGRSTKGRKGKGVTVVTGVALSPPDLEALARALRKRCGSGGSVKDGVIEIQGDHRDALLRELESRGYTVKRSGG